MKTLLFCFVFLTIPSLVDATEACHCKCVTKEDDKYVTVEVDARDREAAGEALKKKLGKKRTCELSPVCTGGC